MEMFLKTYFELLTLFDYVYNRITWMKIGKTGSLGVKCFNIKEKVKILPSVSVQIASSTTIKKKENLTSSIVGLEASNV